MRPPRPRPPTPRALLAVWGALGAMGCNGSAAPSGTPMPDLGAPTDLARPPDLEPPADLVTFHDLVLLPGYPAPHPPLPQVVSSGGPVLQSPELTAVTWQSDPMRTSLSAFVDKVGASGWWRAVASEYGVGAPTVRPAVVEVERPASTLDDRDIQNLLADRLDGTHPEYGRGSAQSLFVVFLPPRVAVTTGRERSCVDFAAYHSEVGLDDGTTVSYAVMPRCQASLDSLTVSASHELIEAATDPRPFSLPAYLTVDPASAGWARVFHGGEVADLCQFDSGAWIRSPELGRLVQRSWSNEAARQSQDPCVPASVNDYYFNAAPVIVDAGGLLELQVGVPRDVELDLFSTGPLPPWGLSAGASPSLDSVYDFAFSSPTGSNGDRVTMTVTLKAAGTPSFNQGFIITSSLGFLSHPWPVAVRVR